MCGCNHMAISLLEPTCNSRTERGRGCPKSAGGVVWVCGVGSHFKEKKGEKREWSEDSEQDSSLSSMKASQKR